MSSSATPASRPGHRTAKPRVGRSGASTARRRTRRWAAAGAVLGGMVSLIVFAPASWLATALAKASQGHVLLAETQGSVWSGSGVLVLAGGADSRDAARLPDRLEWQLRPRWDGLLLEARQPCCIRDTLSLALRPGLGRFTIALADASSPAATPAEAPWQARWPAALLAGLGTPWNTLQPAGSLRLASAGFAMEWAQGRWRQSGRLQLELLELSSRVANVAPLGSYRLTLAAEPGQEGVSSLQLQTLAGALQLSGQGSLSAGRARFNGVAQAAPEHQAGLDNLLNIIGRRDGSRSLISIG